MPLTHAGKQIFMDGVWVADARTEEMAGQLVALDPAPDEGDPLIEAVAREIAKRASPDENPDRIWRCWTAEAQAAIATATPEIIARAAKPWADFHGDLPDYDHAMRPVFESGVQYTVELLAHELSVESYSPCEGTEEFDGDLGGTLVNIVKAAGAVDAEGDFVHPRDLARLAFREDNGDKDGRTPVEAPADLARRISECVVPVIGAVLLMRPDDPRLIDPRVGVAAEVGKAVAKMIAAERD